MRKFLIYTLLFVTLCVLPISKVESNFVSEKKSETTVLEYSTPYVNKMHVNCVQWNSYINGTAKFRAATSQTTWSNGYYWNTLYVYGESKKGGYAAATYITNFKIHLITPYGDNVIYQDKYLLINHKETRAISSLYNLNPNAQYFITWDTCVPF